MPSSRRWSRHPTCIELTHPLNLYTIYFFFLYATPPTEIYTLSLHDALPISAGPRGTWCRSGRRPATSRRARRSRTRRRARSEEHTSELQSPDHLVCRLLLEKKKISADARPAVNKKHPRAVTVPGRARGTSDV